MDEVLAVLLAFQGVIQRFFTTFGALPWNWGWSCIMWIEAVL